jgi:hypothetical protein
MQRFFESLSAFVGFACTALLVFVLLILQPVRLGAESAPPPGLPDAALEDDADVDASVDAAPPPEPSVDATPGSADATPQPPTTVEDSDGCHIAVGGHPRAPAGAALLGVALVAGVLARRRRS